MSAYLPGTNPQSSNSDERGVRLRELATERRRFGYRRLFVLQTGTNLLE